MATKTGPKKPVFVRAKIKLEVDGQILEYRDRNVSLFGVMGLSWRPLVPSVHFGREVMVLVNIPLQQPVIFRTRARITRETTRYSSHMGLKFELGPAQTIKLRKTIEEHGYAPPDYDRKYPRIPAYEWLGDFPVRATVRVAAGKNLRHHFQSIFDISDLSPTGALLETENSGASILVPGLRVQVSLEPRGKMQQGVTLPALVCRTIDALNPRNDNVLRQVGVSFSGATRPAQRVYLAWLQAILKELKRGKRASY